MMDDNLIEVRKGIYRRRIRDVQYLGKISPHVKDQGQQMLSGERYSPVFPRRAV